MTSHARLHKLIQEPVWIQLVIMDAILVLRVWAILRRKKVVLWLLFCLLVCTVSTSIALSATVAQGRLGIYTWSVLDPFTSVIACGDEGYQGPDFNVWDCDISYSHVSRGQRDEKLWDSKPSAPELRARANHGFDSQRQCLLCDVHPSQFGD
ncbi:hypothetical protein EDD85DRAFT_241657 [Armillaria nabsnona]|nr:hypothetical protein EDD85DRAFT_241657 [Armillaria nabsnona]